MPSYHRSTHERIADARKPGFIALVIGVQWRWSAVEVKKQAELATYESSPSGQKWTGTAPSALMTAGAAVFNSAQIVKSRRPTLLSKQCQEYPVEYPECCLPIISAQDNAAIRNHSPRQLALRLSRFTPPRGVFLRPAT